jgi:integrase/recombinase XerD
MLYKSKSIKTQVVFLSSDELKDLEEFKFSQYRLEQVKDWFILPVVH